ncbi:MAG: cytochrome C oxidase subunit IV family protein [Desulfatitalea sp.]|nr:cytochrome C oxidase subunit IV family protein [Desulfatitalea sp.]
MKALILSRVTLIWLILAGATLLSWEMGHGAGFDDIRYASTSIIAIVFIKIRFVILEFMELRHAPVPVRVAAEAWVVVVGTVLIVLYWSRIGAPA